MWAKLSLVLIVLCVAACSRTEEPKEVAAPVNPTPTTILDPLIGTYALVEVDGMSEVQGELSITLNDTEIGFRTKYYLGAESFIFEKLTSPTKTRLQSIENGVRQYTEGEFHIDIKYRLVSGTLSIEATECLPGLCQSNFFVAKDNRGLSVSNHRLSDYFVTAERF